MTNADAATVSPGRRKPQARTRSAAGRPRQFSNEQIIAAALEVMEQEGFAALTLSSLARKLKISHSALYKYIGSIEGLEAEALHFLASQIPLPVPGSAAEMRAQVLGNLSIIRGLLRKHPNVLYPPAGSPAQKIFEARNVAWVLALTPYTSDAQAAYVGYVTLIGVVASVSAADRAYSAADLKKINKERDKRLPPLLSLQDALGRIVDTNFPGLAQAK